MAAVVPKPGWLAFDLQMIEEKLSARKGIIATNGLESFSFTVVGSTTTALSIGPQLAFVTLGFFSSKARSTVYFTSLASSVEPSLHLTPVWSLNVYSVPSGLLVQDSARFGTGLPSLSVASSVS